MNAVTPNEIRKSFGKGPLPGPWGKLTPFQQQIVLLEIQAKFGKGGTAMGMSSGGGMGGGMGMGSSGRLSTGSQGTGLGTGSMQFSVDDISNLQPDELQLYQELGILPGDSEDLMNQMEDQQPGVLDTLSDELTEYFRKELAEKEADVVPPSPITNKQRKDQVEKYYHDQHQYSLAELVINRRGTFGPAVTQQVRKNPERGKYPRSGGRYIDPNIDRVYDPDVPIRTGRPKRRYDPGKNNKYAN